MFFSQKTNCSRDMVLAQFSISGRDAYKKGSKYGGTSIGKRGHSKHQRRNF
jgi:hypothetical protein